MLSHSLNPRRRIIATALMAFSLVILAVGQGELSGQGQGKGKGKGKGKGQRGGKGQGGKVQVKDVPPPAADVTLPAEWVKQFNWRSIGPANMGGRIVGIAVAEDEPTTFWVATASGGLLKTTNNGTSFEHQFDREATVSVGTVCVAPSDKNVVWVGTGEAQPRNSVSYGDGVYKSTDGGKTWKHMGLKDSFQIGKILIHPTDPDTVYVGALGRLYGDNTERGLFKTTDGGEHWDKVFYLDEKTGIIDMRMHPSDPNTLLVAAWDRWRDVYDVGEPARRYGPKAGLYKTTDGGKTFKKLAKGLPTTQFGRIGLDWNLKKDPNVVFAIVEASGAAGGIGAAATLGMQGEDSTNPPGAKVSELTEGGAAATAGLRVNDVITKLGDRQIRVYQDLLEIMAGGRAGDQIKLEVTRGTQTLTINATYGQAPTGGRGGGGGGRGRGGADGGNGPGGVFRSNDAGESWTKLNSIDPRPMYFSQVRVQPDDDKVLYVAGVQTTISTDGGKTFGPIQPNGGRGGPGGGGPRGVHDDTHALWIDPHNGRHMLLGCDGGIYQTYDRGNFWDHLNTVAIGQFYFVSVSTNKQYWVVGGLQDNNCWAAPNVGHSGRGAVNEDWVNVGGGDGFVCHFDPNDPDVVYTESQNGGMTRINLRTGQRAGIGVARGGGGGRGGAAAGGQPGAARGDQPPAGGGQPGAGQPGAGGGGGRGGRGGGFRMNWNTPYILSSHNSHILYVGSQFVHRSIEQGGDWRVISPEITRTNRGSATAVAESPLNSDVLYAGTDDGYLWVTRDAGRNWSRIDDKMGAHNFPCVATIEPSRYAEGRCYVALDAHRQNDDKPYIFETNDYGQTWKSITANLPEFGSTRCLREDLHNPNLLYCGTEFNFFASINRGGSWTKVNNNLPTVAVHEVAQHPTSGEIVVATHGRSLWVLDATTLRQVTADAVAKATLYKPNTVERFVQQPLTGATNRAFHGERPANGAQIYYSLPKQADKVTLEVQSADGKELARLQTQTSAGMHRVSWNLSAGGAGAPGDMPAGGGGRGAGGGDPGAARGGAAGADPAQRGAGAADPAQRGRGNRGGGGGGGGGGRGGRGGPGVAAGTYRVVLTVDGQAFVQSFNVEGAPAGGGGGFGGDDDADDDKDGNDG